MPNRLTTSLTHPRNSSVSKALNACWIAALLRLLLCPSNAVAQNSTQPDLALGKPVTSSVATWGNLIPAALTDGDPGTFSHPLAASSTLYYYFVVDLVSSILLDRVLLHNPTVGCF